MNKGENATHGRVARESCYRARFYLSEGSLATMRWWPEEVECALLRSETTVSIGAILADAGDSMVLVDIGASGGRPSVWNPLMGHATYVGFDADVREFQQGNKSPTRREIVVKKAVTHRQNSSVVHFYFTKNPFCSSTCRPNFRKLMPYLFAERFEVTSEADIPAVTLGDALTSLGLFRIDWLKLDTQGTDLKLYASLEPSLRNKILLLDVEPGLDEWYEGEDQFVDTHKRLLDDGFWLSDIRVGGSPRIRGDVAWPQLRARSRLSRVFYEMTMKRNPTYVEATYIRSIDFLESENASRERLVHAWVGSVVTENLGFALELAGVYERRFGRDDPTAHRLRDESIRRMKLYCLSRAHRLLHHLSFDKFRRFLKREY